MGRPSLPVSATTLLEIGEAPGVDRVFPGIGGIGGRCFDPAPHPGWGMGTPIPLPKLQFPDKSKPVSFGWIIHFAETDQRRQSGVARNLSHHIASIVCALSQSAPPVAKLAIPVHGAAVSRKRHFSERRHERPCSWPTFAGEKKKNAPRETPRGGNQCRHVWPPWLSQLAMALCAMRRFTTP